MASTNTLINSIVKGLKSALQDDAVPSAEVTSVINVERSKTDGAVLYVKLGGTETILDNIHCGRQRKRIVIDAYVGDTSTDAVEELYKIYDALVRVFREQGDDIVGDDVELVSPLLEDSGTYALNGGIGVGMEISFAVDVAVP